MATQVIYVMGDTHGDFGLLNQYINNKFRLNKKFRTMISKLEEEESEKVEVIVLQCGDFGIWKKSDIDNLPLKNRVDFLKDEHIKFYFVDGNHDNHDVLDKLETDNPNNPFPEVAPYVFFATFGSVLTLLDGTNVLFVGGAESEDKELRIVGKEWWEQEGIDENDLARLSNIDKRIDWVISHAAPMSFEVGLFIAHTRPKKIYEPSRYELDKVLEQFKPKQWFFGHYHQPTHGCHNGCVWKGMSYSYGNSDSWISKEIVLKNQNTMNNIVEKAKINQIDK